MRAIEQRPEHPTWPRHLAVTVVDVTALWLAAAADRRLPWLPFGAPFRRP